MKIKLLRKVRNHAAWLIENKLGKFETTNGTVTSLAYSRGYEWAFGWMFCKRLDYYKDREKIICEIAHRSWNYHLRDYWYAKLRKDGRKDGRENQA